MTETIDALEELLRIPDVEDIVLNSRGVSYFKSGKWNGPTVCQNSQHDSLFKMAQTIAESASVVLGLAHPSVDAYLCAKDGIVFRAHVVIPPLSATGIEITFRRLPSLTSYKLNNFTDCPKIQESLKRAIQDGASILVAGATGSGKTSLITSLMGELSQNTRVIILEDSPELPLPNALSTKLLARTNRFGFKQGATWDLSHLVFESLRMRPDRLILGECRGPESAAIARALRTGHKGLMTTIHAGSAKEALERFWNLVENQYTPKDDLSQRSVLWDLVVWIDQNQSGDRRIKELLWTRS